MLLEGLFSLFIELRDLDQWKQQVYDRKYKESINRVILSEAKQSQFKSMGVVSTSITGNISWYAKGLKNPEALTTACWAEYPKGTKFKVTFNSKSVVVTCNDRGNFKQMGRMLDLSSGAFKQLAPLSKGIIRGAKIEVL